MTVEPAVGVRFGKWLVLSQGENRKKLKYRLHREDRGNAHQQTCKICGHPDKFDFTVPDSVWRAILPPAYWTRVVCLSCFDENARERNIDYADSLNMLYFAGSKAAFEFRALKGISLP